MINKRGLSAVITTLIIILLVIVAVGIIWVVVRNVIQEGTEQLDLGAKCLAVDVTAASVTPVAGEDGNYSITLSRRAGGDDIGGVKINVFNATSGVSSGVVDFGITIPELETKTQKIVTSVTNSNKIEFTVFFLDESGNDLLCPQTNTWP